MSESQKDLMAVLSIKYNFRSGITIDFESSVLIKQEYVYMFVRGVEKFFQILEVSTSLSSENLTYKAVECGYGQDKLSNLKELDIRDFLNQPLVEILSKESAIEVRKRSSYT